MGAKISSSDPVPYHCYPCWMGFSRKYYYSRKSGTSYLHVLSTYEKTWKCLAVKSLKTWYQIVKLIIWVYNNNNTKSKVVVGLFTRKKKRLKGSIEVLVTLKGSKLFIYINCSFIFKFFIFYYNLIVTLDDSP